MFEDSESEEDDVPDHGSGTGTIYSEGVPGCAMNEYHPAAMLCNGIATAPDR